MLYFAKWKIGLILAVCVAGIFYALPNLMAPLGKHDFPSWWQPVNLGLDLQGGSHLLLEVAVDDVVKEQLNGLVESTRTTLREQKIVYRDLSLDGQTVVVRIPDAAGRDAAIGQLSKLDQAITVKTEGDDLVRLAYTQQALNDRKQAAVKQSIEIVRRRIDESGTREPTIQRQGADRIIVELPGESDPERVKRLIGKTAKLNFHMVDSSVSPEDALRGRVPPGSRLLPAAEGSHGPKQYVVKRAVEVGGDRLTDASATFQSTNNEPVVSFRFDSIGGRRFGEATTKNVGQQLAIVLDDQVISAPVVREPILGGSGVISGSFTVQGAQDLALLLRAGALPAPLTVLEERSVGPGLGQDSIQAGAAASVIGLVVVVVFMMLCYGMFGLIANVALVLNLVLLLACLQLLGATLTLPGIAGIVLTMGMAVDANVLIYERMREEERAGRGAMNAAESGFRHAFGTIFDSNITTLAAAVLLFFFGTGPVRGFAVTLSLGIITSMFTATMFTRFLVSLWFRRVRPKTLPI